MMVFSRFFSSRKELAQSKKGKERDRNFQLNSFQSVPRLPKLSKDKIRVLIYKESERRSDKTLMFDSDAIVCLHTHDEKANCKSNMPQNSTSNSAAFEIQHGLKSPKYQCNKPSSDVKMLGEMIFGSVAMVYKASVLKVHFIRSPPQLLMTKVFALRSRSAGVSFNDREFFNSARCNDSIDSIPDDSSLNYEPSRTYSNPVKMSHPSCYSVQSSLANTYCRNGSSWSLASLDNPPGLSSSFASLSSLSRCSPNGSMRQSFLRSRHTSFKSWRTNSEVSEEMRSAYRQQPKIGIGVIFKLWDKGECNRDFQKFFFSHHTLFESHLQTLRIKLEKSFYLRQRFMDAASTAINDFKEDLMQLYFSPRINEPVWLNLMVTESCRKDIADKFMGSFVALTNICETKEKKYFLSSLLTAVLTYHLSWIATVMSCSKDSKRAYLDKHASNTMNILSKSHPYNPLWAQLCDLFGSVTNPMVFSKAVVVGKDASLVCELLKLLSYFIRCCDIKENRLRMVKSREYRLSESSLSSTFLNQTPSSPISVHSWVDNTNQINNTEKINIKNEESIPKVTTNLIKEKLLKNKVNEADIELTSCYCHLLQNMDKMNEKDLTKYIFRFDNIKIHNLLDVSKDNDIFKNNGSPKSCYGCGTLEKKIFDTFCDSCKNVTKNDVSLEIDLICQHCLSRLQKIKHSTALQEKEKTLKSAVSTNCCSNLQQFQYSELSVTLKNDITPVQSNIQPLRKASFVCYCCPKLSEENAAGTETLVEGNCNNDEKCSFPPRCRNSSDPMNFIIPKKNCMQMRNSTNSQDSGTEMSFTSSCQEDSLAFGSTSRHDSLSSQDDLSNADQSAVDSDYCSVDNEALTLTMVKSISKDELNEQNVLTPRNEDLTPGLSDDEFRKHFNVSKSLSSTTLKDLTLNLSTENNSNLIHAEEPLNSLKNEIQLMNLQEVKMPRVLVDSPPKSSASTNGSFESYNYGRSLLAGYCDSYQSNFILHGTPELDKKKLATDLQNSVKYSILDEQISDAVCIVADTDNWTCDLWTLSNRPDALNRPTSVTLDTKTMIASNLVSSMVESTNELYDMEMSAQFCLLHIEEQLKDIYNRARVVATQVSRSNNMVDTSTLLKDAGYHESDVNLLKAITSTFI